jgi:hypothetical protein
MQNLWFITVDDLRPQLGCDGKSFMRKPNIADLAQRGMYDHHRNTNENTASQATQKHDSTVIALASHWHRTGIALASHWHRTGIALASHCPGSSIQTSPRCRPHPSGIAASHFSRAGSGETSLDQLHQPIFDCAHSLS